MPILDSPSNTNLSTGLIKQNHCFVSLKINLFQPSVAFYMRTSHLFCRAN